MKKATIQITFITLYFLFITASGAPSFFTHNLSGGRLGDNLIAYAQCKYLSWKHNAPMFYSPFKYADQFIFSSQEKTLTSVIRRSFQHKKKINHENELNHLNPDTLYTVSYKVKIHDGIVATVWKEPQFQSILKELLRPKSSFQQLNVPNNMLTVAVHIRKGSGGDRPLASEQIYSSNFATQSLLTTKTHRRSYSDKSPHVLKFPPEQYYIDQLILLSELLDNIPLYVCIFTDSKNPQKLIQRIKKYTKKRNITFNYKKNGNTDRAGDISAVLEDFYDMTMFNIIIRADSNLSKAAQLIGNHIIGIHPHKHHWENDRLIIDESCALIRHTKKPYVHTYILPRDTQTFCLDLHHTLFS